MANNRASNANRRPKIPQQRDIWLASVRGHISDEEGHDLNPKYTTANEYNMRTVKTSEKMGEAKRGDKNPRSPNNPAFEGSRNDPNSPAYKDRGK